ncbi:MAG: hypothetical protein H8E35_10665 [Ardenticatenia bacterium]|nr:hypothetical protein [Ardenticatenia bacterium]
MNRKTRDRLIMFIFGLLLIAAIACGWGSPPTMRDCECLDALGKTYACVCE